MDWFMRDILERNGDAGRPDLTIDEAKARDCAVPIIDTVTAGVPGTSSMTAAITSAISAAAPESPVSPAGTA